MPQTPLNVAHTFLGDIKKYFSGVKKMKQISRLIDSWWSRLKGFFSLTQQQEKKGFYSFQFYLMRSENRERQLIQLVKYISINLVAALTKWSRRLVFGLVKIFLLVFVSIFVASIDFRWFFYTRSCVSEGRISFWSERSLALGSFWVRKF